MVGAVPYKREPQGQLCEINDRIKQNGSYGNRTMPFFRYLARWEKLNADWDAIEKELAICPFNPHTKRTPESIVLCMWIDGNILDYPSMGGGVVNNHYSLIEQINKGKRELGVPSLPQDSYVSWGSQNHNGPRHHYHIYLHVWVTSYCEHTKRPYQITIDPEIIPPLKQTSFCWFWWHNWEVVKDFVRSDGTHAGWFSSVGIQKAIFHCKKCGRIKLMYREGVVGLFEGESTQWMNCDKMTENRIDLMPRL